MSQAKYIVHYAAGPYRGIVGVYADQHADSAHVLAKAKRIVWRDVGRKPLGFRAGNWRIAEVEPVKEGNPGKKKGKKPALTQGELDVLASLESARYDFWDLPPDEQTRQFFESDGPSYKAAKRLEGRGLATMQAAGAHQEEEWILLSLSEKGAEALERVAKNPAKRGVKHSGTIVLAVGERDSPGQRTVHGAELIDGVLAIHPSVRNLKEIEEGIRQRPLSWGLTHVPTGQLMATLHSKDWARKLGKEIIRFSDNGLGSTDVNVAAAAIGGPGKQRIRYILEVQKASQKPGRKPKTFPKYSAWKTKQETSPYREVNVPHDLARDAALAAAVGSLLGGLVGAVGGAALLGVIGGTVGGLAGGSAAMGPGAVAGAIFGLPLGAYVGTIWGAVRQTGKALKGYEGHEARTARLLAGIGAGVSGPLAPVGAGVGAYLGAMD